MSTHRTEGSPLRLLHANAVRDGVHVLAASAVEYEDGSERDVLAKIERATDRSSLSDELRQSAEGVHEEYHFALSRANALRALTPSSVDIRVLEIGAGCGSISRWLGETFELVDAVEPMLARARAAAARVAGLDSVRVFCTDLSSVPAEPTYDLVVVNGVLEYVAGNGASEADVVEFLASVRTRLAPEGIVFLAIENRLGVKYLAGAPEDHTGRVFDGIEEYPVGTHARTFSRSELTNLLTQSGLASSFLHAFPDYKQPRAIFDDGLLEQPLAPLAWRTPLFPSHGPATQGASELRLWRSLVSDQIGQRFANSFVVLAAPDRSAIDAWWPTSQRLAYFSVGRNSLFSTITRVTTDAGDITFSKRRLRGDEPASAPDVQWTPTDESWIDAPNLVEYISRGADPEEVLPQWIDAMRAHRQVPGRERDSDTLPHNCLRTNHGALVFIDQEFADDTTEDDLIVRGLATLALGLARDTSPTRWIPATTPGELVEFLAGAAEVVLPEDWRDRFLAIEVRLADVVGLGAGTLREDLGGALDAPLEPGPLGARAMVSASYADLAEQRLEHIRTLESQMTDLRRIYVSMVESRGWRFLESLRGLRRGRIRGTG